MKMPEPIITPTTTIVESNKPRLRAKVLEPGASETGCGEVLVFMAGEMSIGRRAKAIAYYIQSSTLQAVICGPRPLSTLFERCAAFVTLRVIVFQRFTRLAHLLRAFRSRRALHEIQVPNIALAVCFRVGYEIGALAPTIASNSKCWASVAFDVAG
jgi:hypothetical protein